MMLPPLNTILTFLAVVEHGRFNRAASSLSLTESAVSHQIRKLEETLGVRLMDRGRSGPTLTDAGERFYLKSSIAVKQLREAVEDISEDTQERIVITLPTSLATLWLSSNLWSFYEVNQQAEVSILPTERLCKLEAERIDLGIRYTSTPGWETYDWRVLWEETFFPVMTPDKAADLSKRGWSEFSKNSWFAQNQMHKDECSLWCGHFDVTPPPRERIKIMHSFEHVVNAALNGQCVAMGRGPMVDQFIEDGRLVSPFGEKGRIKTGFSYYAVWPKHAEQSKLTEKIISWLEAQVVHG